MGSENWAFKRIWVCFIPQPAGTVPWLNFWWLCVFLFHYNVVSSIDVDFFSSVQDAQSAINDLSGTIDAFYSVHGLCYLHGHSFSSPNKAVIFSFEILFHIFHAL